MNNITTKEAMEILGCGRTTLYSYVNKGNLTTIKEGSRTFFSEDELLDLRPTVKAKQKKHSPEAIEKEKKVVVEKNKRTKKIESLVDTGKQTISHQDSLNAVGERELKRVTKLLKEYDVYHELDHALLITYAISYQSYLKYQKLALESDSLEVDMTGNLKPHPYHRIAMDHANNMMKLANHLGLHPVSRIKLSMHEKPEVDEMEGLLS